jgi:hypothetical protein
MEMQTRKRLAKEILFLIGFLTIILASYHCHKWFYEKYYNVEDVEKSYIKEEKTLLTLDSLRQYTRNSIYNKHFSSLLKTTDENGYEEYENLRKKIDNLEYSEDSIQQRCTNLLNRKKLFQNYVLPFKEYMFKALFVMFCVYGIRLLFFAIPWAIRTLREN